MKQVTAGLLRNSIFIIAICLVAAPEFNTAQAQIVPPKPVEQLRPDAPRSRDDFPREGWIVLRYSVFTDGTTGNISVVDQLPPRVPYRRAVSAVEDWIFKPATVNGVAVDWHNNEALIVYRSEEAPLSPLFDRAYKATQTLIEDGNLEWARRNNERTLTRANRLSAIVMALIQRAIISLQLNDLNTAYTAIASVTDPRVGLLDGNYLAIALKHRNFLEFQLGNIIAALETLERRKALGPVPEDDPIAAIAPTIERSLREGSTIGHRAKILDDFWRHSLSRQVFAIDQVIGEIDAIYAECDRRITELEYAPESEWTLPVNWGDCHVAIEGEDDTEFVLYEFGEAENSRAVMQNN